MQQGCELQDQVVDPGYHSLKSHCELLKMLFFLTGIEQFWNLRMEKSSHYYYKIFLNNWFTMLMLLQNQPTFFFQFLPLKSSHRRVKNTLLTTILNRKNAWASLSRWFWVSVDFFLVSGFNYFIISFFDKFEFILNGIVFWHFTRWPYLCVTVIWKLKASLFISKFQTAGMT